MTIGCLHIMLLSWLQARLDVFVLRPLVFEPSLLRFKLGLILDEISFGREVLYHVSNLLYGLMPGLYMLLDGNGLLTTIGFIHQDADVPILSDQVRPASLLRVQKSLVRVFASFY